MGDCPHPAANGLCEAHRAHLSQATQDYFAWKGEWAPKPHRKGVRRLKPGEVTEVLRLPGDPVPLIRWSQGAMSDTDNGSADQP
jgi:hypothetical protein